MVNQDIINMKDPLPPLLEVVTIINKRKLGGLDSMIM